MHENLKRNEKQRIDGDVIILPRIRCEWGQHTIFIVTGGGEEWMSLYEGLVSEFVEFLSNYFYFLYEIGGQVIC